MYSPHCLIFPCESPVLLYFGTEIQKQISSFLAISFLTARYLRYNIVQVSAIHQHESATDTHTSSASRTSHLPPHPTPLCPPLPPKGTL